MVWTRRIQFNHIIDEMNRFFENDALQEKSVLNINQTLNKMIDTFERIEVNKIIDNERKIQKLIQRNWAMISFIRQQNPHNSILAAIMHDKIKRIQQMMNALSWTACYKNECQIHFSKKKESSWYSKKSRRQKKIFIQW